MYDVIRVYLCMHQVCTNVGMSGDLSFVIIPQTTNYELHAVQMHKCT